MKKVFKRLSYIGRSKPIQLKEDDRAHVAVMPILRPEAGDEEMPKPSPKTSLEGLPVEIQSTVLLNIRDISSLKSLICASPACRSTYLRQRQAILQRVLFNSIHLGVLYDAFSAINSSKTLTSNVKDRIARVKEFLSEYKDNRNVWTSPEHLDLQSAFKLARLQDQVQHVTDDLCQRAFSSHPFTGDHMEHCEQLSSNEKRRFYRAFYRFVIFCNLFRNWVKPPDDESHSDASFEDGDSAAELGSMEISSCFLDMFNPWEVEELACIRDYLYNYYHHLIHKYEPDLRERHPHLDLSDDGPWLDENIEFLMALGLHLYRRIETSSPGRQMRFLDHGLHSGPSFLSDALNEPPQAAVYQTLAVDEPEEVHFEGDSAHSGPNVMWLWVTGNKMNFDYYLWQNEPLREWGYVFWDQKRLQQWGVPNEEYETWVERRRAGLRKALDESKTNQTSST